MKISDLSFSHHIRKEHLTTQLNKYTISISKEKCMDYYMTYMFTTHISTLKKWTMKMIIKSIKIFNKFIPEDFYYLRPVESGAKSTREPNGYP